MASLRSALASIGEPAGKSLALWAGFGGRMPASLRRGMTGMSDPDVGNWHKVGTACTLENKAVSAEGQGFATDGVSWYVCSNNIKSVEQYDNALEHVRSFEFNSFKSTPKIRLKDGIGIGTGKVGPLSGSTHFGAPHIHENRLYVPIQGPRGILRCLLDDSGQELMLADSLPNDDLFAWCAVHPFNGLLYTANYDRPSHLRAYRLDPSALIYAPKFDIPLGAPSIDLDRVQGGVFTPHGRLILVRCDFNAIFCYSSLNGHFFGARMLGDFGSSGSEAESVALRSLKFGDQPAMIHVTELDNDALNDDLYLHSYSVPLPDQL